MDFRWLITGVGRIAIIMYTQCHTTNGALQKTARNLLADSARLKSATAAISHTQHHLLVQDLSRGAAGLANHSLALITTTLLIELLRLASALAQGFSLAHMWLAMHNKHLTSITDL